MRKREAEAALKKLQRCEVVLATAETLHAMLSDLEPDSSGCVTHEVEYEQKGAALRGRLFAIGEEVHVRDSKFPRTATLQGMPSDLRCPLVGAFAHDVDCENSEVRLLCSVATQLNMKKLIPTLINYRDNRSTWIEKLASVYRVSKQEAKRLANVILSGGTMRTWLRKVDRTIETSSAAGREVRNFAFRLESEARALREALVQHPRFKWTHIEREKLKDEERKHGAQIEDALLPRIVEACENEVLSIVHRAFHDGGWAVRALVFDGLIVEPPPSAVASGRQGNLDMMLRTAEGVCRARGWDVRLAEKELHGLQDRELGVLEGAREALAVGRCYW